MSYRKTILGLAAAFLLLGLFGIYLDHRGHNQTHQQLAVLNVQQQASGIVRRHISNHPFRADEYFCRQQNTADLCQVLQTKLFPDLGNHNDLWVSLDAVYMLQSSSTLDRQRKAELNARVSLLYIAVANYNGLPPVSADSDALPGSNALYQGILGQAALCLSMPQQIDCTHGLPRQTAEALQQVLSFLVKEGPAAAAYEMRNRVPSANTVLAGWLQKI